MAKQYTDALERKQVGECLALLEAAEKLGERLDAGILDVTNHVETMQELTVRLVHQLPRDYRVVWKQVRRVWPLK